MENLKFTRQHLLSIIDSVLRDNANVEKYEESGFGTEFHVTSNVEMALIESVGLHYDLRYVRIGNPSEILTADDIQAQIFNVTNTPEIALDLLLDIPRKYRPSA